MLVETLGLLVAGCIVTVGWIALLIIYKSAKEVGGW